MAYNEAQLNATVTYILNFFHSRINETGTTVVGNNMFIFENHLKRIFLRELPQFKPDKFELKKIGSSEPYFIDWIDKNILPFPENFSVSLSNDGNSIAMHGDIKRVIYSPSCTPDSSVDMSIGSDSMSICTPSPSEKESKQFTKIFTTKLVSICPLSIDPPSIKATPNTESTRNLEAEKKTILSIAPKQYVMENEQNKELNETEKKEQEQIFFNSCYEVLYEYLKQIPEKTGKKRIIIHDSSHVDINNIYKDNEQPKYDDKTGGMYIPIYKKDKYEEVYRILRAAVTEKTNDEKTILPKKNELCTFQMQCEELLNNLKDCKLS